MLILPGNLTFTQFGANDESQVNVYIIGAPPGLIFPSSVYFRADCKNCILRFVNRFQLLLNNLLKFYNLIYRHLYTVSLIFSTIVEYELLLIVFYK